MKQITTILLLLISLACSGQTVSLPCYAEITIDTVPAVKLSLGAWEQKGFTVSPAEVRDTIGTRVEEVIRIFYIQDGEKKYLDFIQRNYVSGVEDVDRRFEGYNY